MIPLNAIKLIGLGCLLAALTACGDSKISAVKDTRLHGDEFTVGETLSKIKECKSSDWTSEIMNNATIVTHTCSIKLTDDIRDKAKQAELAALKTRSSLAGLSVSTDLSGARSAQVDAGRRSEERAAQAAQKLAEMDRSIERAANATWSPWISLTGAPLTRPSAPPAPGVWEAKLQADVAVLSKQKEALLATFEAERQKSAEAAQAAQHEIDEAAQWSEKFEREAVQTHAAVVKDVDAFYNKNHDVKVKTLFRYREGENAELLSSTFTVDDVESKGTIPVYLMDPKRMAEYLVFMTKYGLGMKAPDLFDERFPIESVPGAYPGKRIYRYKGAKPAG
ncbi:MULTISPECIES: hypothetical protein [unclassified Variovorax]|uniref:hypothetical protein n=1 Tax=unclassified Variovorax TaxID=663243 RepID=UPI0032E7C6C3